jgi:hypothetical protein
MDAAALQDRIYAGYGHAAKRTGFNFEVHRPTSQWRGPIDASSRVATIPANFTVYGTGFQFEKQSTYKQPTYNGMFDARVCKVGDYLFNAVRGTYFIAGLAEQGPPLCVGCNRTVSITSAGPAKSFGAQAPYSGADPAKDQDVLVNWPASIIYDARGRANEQGLPLDLGSPFFGILLPATPGIDIRSGMIVTDDQTRRYIIGAAENTQLGWRISSQQAVT